MDSSVVVILHCEDFADLAKSLIYNVEPRHSISIRRGGLVSQDVSLNEATLRYAIHACVHGDDENQLRKLSRTVIIFLTGVDRQNYVLTDGVWIDNIT